MSKRSLKHLLWLLAFVAGTAYAGAQKYEPLSASVRSQLSKAVSDAAVEKAADRIIDEVWQLKKEGQTPAPVEGKQP